MTAQVPLHASTAMTDTPRRPTLHLKVARAPVLPPGAPPRKPAPASPPPAAVRWKCKPCGAGFELPTDAPDDFIVRCPSCTARLGKLIDFTAAPDGSGKVRARPVRVTPSAR